MAIPRSEVVDDDRSGIYHCYDRCVRRYRLLASRDDLRRRWLVDQLHHLAQAFAMDVVSNAVLENHLHTILRTHPELVHTWSDREIAYRWLLIRPNRARRRRMGLPLEGPPHSIEVDLVCDQPGRIAVLRRRLSSMSWFMKELKEPIARRANRDDDTNGRFWQDRFKCNRLVDDEGVLNCATYVDMNPVAAGMADDALTASFTSVQEHMRRLWPKLGEVVATTGRDAAGSTLEELLAHLDEVEFTPAIPCRREPHLAPEAHEPIDPQQRPVTAAAGSASTSASADHFRRSTMRRVQPLAILGLSLGSYLRRLAAISRFTIALRAAIPMALRCDTPDPAARAPGLGGLVQRVLDGLDTSAEALTQLVVNARFWGTAIGSSASLEREAARRGRQRVACGLR